MTAWQTWLVQPQQLWVRRAIFQVHLWTGIGAGLYILVACLTGSLVVYGNELYKVATPPPIIVTPVGERLAEPELKRRAEAAYPGFHVSHVFRPRIRNAAVDIWLEREGGSRKRLFNPFTGEDLAPSVPTSIRLVSWLIDLHDNLLGGRTGRMVNGIGGVVTALVGLTGLIVWWPGAQNWRRGLIVRRRTGWKRLNWDLHSAVGFWTLGFLILFGITGAYLGFPNFFARVADWVQKPTDENIGTRFVDELLYWIARLHFGRFGGGWTKAVWAVAGLAPVALFVTGTLMWWNRVLAPRFRRALPDPPLTVAAPAMARSSLGVVE